MKGEFAHTATERAVRTALEMGMVLTPHPTLPDICRVHCPKCRYGTHWPNDGFDVSIANWMRDPTGCPVCAGDYCREKWGRHLAARNRAQTANSPAGNTTAAKFDTPTQGGAQHPSAEVP